MLKEIQRLFKDFSFLLKAFELLLACICLYELSKYSEYMIPKWLWIIYCIDSFTYAIVYFSIAMTHVFEKPRKVSEFTYFSLGVIFNFIGGIAGIERGRSGDSENNEHRNELKIGLLLLGNMLLCDWCTWKPNLWYLSIMQMDKLDT
ncbi:uncharacterized protein LOC117604568 isoform X2 [Osmia lignaria lignaria]|uniref:uncharacterized protein LOC117604568 isoform X2 n=1 Tax=Osmia lignaria lignaria TaxID=1437193 RepID=UPI00402B4A8F